MLTGVLQQAPPHTQAHIRTILEAPPLKERSGKELRRLHDCAAASACSKGDGM